MFSKWYYTICASPVSQNCSLRSKSCILNFCGFWKGKHATVQLSSQGRFTFLLFWVVLCPPHCSCPLIQSIPCSLDQHLPLQSSATARTFTCELVALSHPIRWKKLSPSEAGGIVGDFSQRPLASPLEVSHSHVAFEPRGHKATIKGIGIHRKVMNDGTEVKSEVGNQMSDNSKFPRFDPQKEKEPGLKLNVFHASCFYPTKAICIVFPDS